MSGSLPLFQGIYDQLITCYGGSTVLFIVHWGPPAGQPNNVLVKEQNLFILWWGGGVIKKYLCAVAQSEVDEMF